MEKLGVYFAWLPKAADFTGAEKVNSPIWIEWNIETVAKLKTQFPHKNREIVAIDILSGLHLWYKGKTWKRPTNNHYTNCIFYSPVLLVWSHEKAAWLPSIVEGYDKLPHHDGVKIDSELSGLSIWINDKLPNYYRG